MNGNTSTAGYKNPERLPDAAALERQWKTIDWKKAEAVVSRLQARIAKAIVTNYWHSKGLRHWIFSSGKMELLCLGDVPIVRHTKIRMDMNPYLDTEYFVRRKFRQGMKRLSGRFKKIWRNQNGCCYHCGLPMEISDEREIFYKVPLSMGGKDEVSNMAYVHKYCQSIFLERRAKV